MNRSLRRIGPAVLSVLTLGLTACASSGSTSDTAATVTTAALPAAGGVGVQIGDNPLGKILTDSSGLTLYLFTKDSPTTSACDNGCAANWPALQADTVPTLGPGLDAEDFTLITRSDGTKQVAFYGHPLYHFAADAKAGDTNGQGLNGVWFVLDGEGNAVGA